MYRLHRIRGAKRGFTLMETLIVIAVIAILTAIAIPVTKNAIASSQKKACIHGRQVLESSAEAAAMTLSGNAATQLISTRLDPYKGVHKDLCPAGGNIRMLHRGDGSVFLYCDVHDGGTSLNILNHLDNPGSTLLNTALGPNQNGSTTYNLIDYFTKSLSARLDANGNLYFVGNNNAQSRTVDSTGYNFGNVSKTNIMTALSLPDTNFDYCINYNKDTKLFDVYIFDLLADHSKGDTLEATKYTYKLTDPKNNTLELQSTTSGSSKVKEKTGIQNIHDNTSNNTIKVLDYQNFKAS